jgi:hypothetical protein
MEDIFADSFGILGEKQYDPNEGGVVRYGQLKLMVAAKVGVSWSEQWRNVHADAQKRKPGRKGSLLILTSVRLCTHIVLIQATTLLADALFSPSLFLAEQIRLAELDLAGKTGELCMLLFCLSGIKHRNSFPPKCLN